MLWPSCNACRSQKHIVIIWGTEIARKHISHLIIWLLVKNLFFLAAIFDFCPCKAKRGIWFMGNFMRALYGYLWIIRPIFGPETQISTQTLFHELAAAIFRIIVIIKNVQRCQSSMLAHITLDISCINNPQNKFARFHPRRHDYISDSCYHNRILNATSI